MKPVGTSFLFGSSESDKAVFAMQMGKRPYPCRSYRSTAACASAESEIPSAPYNSLICHLFLHAESVSLGGFVQVERQLRATGGFVKVGYAVFIVASQCYGERCNIAVKEESERVAR